MNDSFEIPVLFDQAELIFPARVIKQGFSHKILVEVNCLQIIYEPDEEGKYRAIIDEVLIERADKISVPLLKAIAQAIESIVH